MATTTTTQTRYQVMVIGHRSRFWGPKVNRNFTAGQKAAALAYMVKLRAEGHEVDMWDTRNNAMSRALSTR